MHSSSVASPFENYRLNEVMPMDLPVVEEDDSSLLSEDIQYLSERFSQYDGTSDIATD